MIESDSMREILRLKQELMDGNYDRAIKLVTELQTMCLDDRINMLSNFLSLAISRLIVVQVNPEYVYLSNIYELRNALIEIKNKNRQGRDSFYVKVEDWLTIYENAVPWALLLAVETTEILDNTDVQDLQEQVDFERLKKETLMLVRLTYTFDDLEIHEYLRSRWLDRQIHHY